MALASLNGNEGNELERARVNVGGASDDMGDGDEGGKLPVDAANEEEEKGEEAVVIRSRRATGNEEGESDDAAATLAVAVVEVSSKLKAQTRSIAANNPIMINTVNAE